jgi:uncharacterized protein YcbX
MSYIVSQIWIYPLKSLGGIPMQRAQVLAKGLSLDRRWMLIDHDNTFMTQRVNHGMALFKTSLAGNQVRVSYQGSAIDIPVTSQGPELNAVIWDDTVKVVEVDPVVSKWFTERLGSSCRLVSFPEANTRNVDPKYNLGNTQVSLADGYPLLVIGEGTLDDLNSRMEKPLPMNRFRPNIVFTGGEPFIEDMWKNFKVGDNGFAAVKPCGRCALPTVDQETGVMGKEPLATLNKYRKRDNKVLFGMNLIPLDHNWINVGDEITF